MNEFRVASGFTKAGPRGRTGLEPRSNGTPHRGCDTSQRCLTFPEVLSRIECADPDFREEAVEKVSGLAGNPRELAPQPFEVIGSDERAALGIALRTGQASRGKEPNGHQGDGEANPAEPAHLESGFEGTHRSTAT